MRFSVYFDCIVNEIFFFFFHTEIMISVAHMQHAHMQHATLREFFLKMCNLMRLGEYFDQILY